MTDISASRPKTESITSKHTIMIKIGNTRNLILVLAMLLLPVAAMADGINKGFYKKAAEKVWAIDDEKIFDAATVIPDSISQGQSGVIIARQDYFEVNREEQNAYYEAGGRTNRTKVTHARRTMVKLLDHSAVERYSEFEFGGSMIRQIYGFIVRAASENAFGARVHKPDGTVADIDLSTALEISHGKKGGKDKTFRIAIPALEVGDVIEYFYFNEYMKESGNISGIDMVLTDRYPIMTRLITGTFDPSLTSEFYSYNGAPSIVPISGGDRITARMEVNSVPAIAFDKFVYDERQLPFIRLNVINNFQRKGENYFIASTARPGGVYSSVNTGSIIREAKENIAFIADYLDRSTRSISPIPDRALKVAKNYAKNHPEATPRQLADAAYMAVRYCNLIADEDNYVSSPFMMAMFMKNVVDKLKIYPKESTGIGIINSRTEVPTEELSGWNQSNFIYCAADTAYMMFPGFNIAPGELPGLFQGEKGRIFQGNLRNAEDLSQITEFIEKDRLYSGNQTKAALTVSLLENDPSILEVVRSVELTGCAKRAGRDLVDYAEWIRGAEKHLDIAKPYKIKEYDELARENELREALSAECAAVSGFTPDSIMAYTVDERGFLPGSEAMKYTMQCHVSGLVENLGNDISVTLGRLLGHVEKIDGSERERFLDAMLPSAYQNSHTLTLKVPQGYKVDATSLEDFNRNVGSSIGAFAAKATVNDAGDVEVQCLIRVKRATIPLQFWPQLRDLYDAGSQFADASIVLVKNNPDQ